MKRALINFCLHAVSVVSHDPTVRKASAAFDAVLVSTLAVEITKDGLQVSDLTTAVTLAILAALAVFKRKANGVR